MRMGINIVDGWAVAISFLESDPSRDVVFGITTFQSLEDAVKFSGKMTEELFEGQGVKNAGDIRRKILGALSDELVKAPGAAVYTAGVDNCAVTIHKTQLHLSGPLIRTEDLWTMLLSTIRYSMGRRSYVTGLTSDLVKLYSQYLEPTELDQIKREVSKEIEVSEQGGRTLGDPPDHEIWKNLVKFLTERIAKWRVP
jgi:hypothetical protein